MKLKQSFQEFKKIIKIFSEGFDSHGMMSYAAAIAFYMIFSLPGLLITCIAVAGLVMGEQTVQGEVSGQLKSILGESAAATIENVIQNISFKKDNTWRTILGVATLLFSATTVFMTLQEALNKIWNVVATPKTGILKMVINRLLSFGMVLSLGLILLVSLLLDTVLEISFKNLEAEFGKDLATTLEVTSNLTSFVIIFVVIMLIFKLLPDVRLKWRDVALASLLTTALFVLGKYLIGIYLQNSSFTETYSATGSIIVFLVWVYYSTVVVLFGAEVTRTVKTYRGQPIEPSSGAKKLKIDKVEYDEYLKAIKDKNEPSSKT